MTITSFWSSSPTLASQAPGSIMATDSDLATAPASLSEEKFRLWDRSKQLQYIHKHGSVQENGKLGVLIGTGSRQILVAEAETNTLVLKLASTGSTFTTQNLGRKATDQELATSPALLDAATFLAWREEDRLAYAEANGPSLKLKGAPVNLGKEGAQKQVGMTSDLYVSVEPDVSIGSGALFNTRGDLELIPYQHLSGTADGMPSAIVKASAEALFPDINSVDSTGRTLKTLPVEDRPDAFYTKLSDLADDAKKLLFLQDFAKWHSGYQLEWVKLNGGGTAANPNNPPMIDIEAPSPPPGTRLTAMISLSDPEKLIIAQSLDKAAIARLTNAEQIQLIGTDAFVDMRTKLQLDAIYNLSVPSVTTSETVTAETAVAQLKAYIDGKKTEVLPGGQLMPSDDRLAFTKQLDILTEQLGGMSVVSPADINKKLSELKDRFERAFAFYDVKGPTVTPGVPMGIPKGVTVTTYKDVISTDDLQTINKGYQIFIAQEKRIADLAESRMQLVRDNGLLFGKNLDAPYLIYKFQSLYNLELEAQVVAETEEINQQNALLKTYAAIQDAVNKTLATFTEAGKGETRIFGLTDDDVDSYQYTDAQPDKVKITDAQKKLLSMFDGGIGMDAQQKHPLERLRGLQRPLGEIFVQAPGQGSNYDLAKLSNNQWSIFGTRLSEAVTIINQNSQLKMNDVNTMDKERNRHFELANNALSKMNEMIQNIARS